MEYPRGKKYKNCGNICGRKMVASGLTFVNEGGKISVDVFRRNKIF